MWFSSDQLTLRLVFYRFSNHGVVFIENLGFWGVSVDPHELKDAIHYQAQQLVLTPKEDVRDLGVYMNAGASFTKHIDFITDTARKLDGI